MTPLYVIGDIHGCFDEMYEMLEAIHTDALKLHHYLKYTVAFVGDYIDRGPKSFEVIDYLSKWHDNEIANYVFLMGNHEDMMIDSEISPTSRGYGASWMHNGGRETSMSYRRNGATKIPFSHETFLKNLRYSYQHPGIRPIIVAHAGIDPTLRLDSQSNNVMLWSRNYIDYNGEYRDNAYVVFGHTPSNTVIERKNHVGIDTGCVFGEKLTCVVFRDYDEKTNEFTKEFIEIKSKI